MPVPIFKIRTKREIKRRMPMKFFRNYVQYFREWRRKIEDEARFIRIYLFNEFKNNYEVKFAVKSALLATERIYEEVNLHLLLLPNVEAERMAIKVFIRLYYYFYDRSTGSGVNHAGVLIDGKEFHFTDNGRIEIYAKDGYKAAGHNVDHIKDYQIGETYLNEAEIESVFEGFCLNEFVVGTYRNKVFGEVGTNNCLTFAHTFVGAIVQEKPQNWPIPLERVYYGNYKDFMTKMELA